MSRCARPTRCPRAPTTRRSPPPCDGYGADLAAEFFARRWHRSTTSGDEGANRHTLTRRMRLRSAQSGARGIERELASHKHAAIALWDGAGGGVLKSIAVDGAGGGEDANGA